ncbi:hypothetical protein Shell_0278 [Staphylothermus hellenicus DSM 12710]|uniref:Uncharacterized protein n=1 Tax=Staphylothermus hellenicus (strain DSM 12710 / JCM 10830 / BK20S6-10-b1 / P8) TaxID=591019 RepID=D7DB69_STAHD|nr:hypothetical protein Shell_0278 [Staphylothermus hellenicus DSM 12710]
MKTKILRPVRIGDDKVEVTVFSEEEKSWEKHRIRSSKNILDRMMAMANNMVIMNLQDNAYVFSEVEAPGLRAIVGEGMVEGVETILSPKPSLLLSIEFGKKTNDHGEIIHKIKPEPNTWIYEGSIINKNIDYDLVILKTADGPRIILPDELYIPQRKSSGGKKTKKKKRRKRKHASKKSVKKSAKTSKTTKKSKKTKKTRRRKRRRKK